MSDENTQAPEQEPKANTTEQEPKQQEQPEQKEEAPKMGATAFYRQQAEQHRKQLEEMKAQNEDLMRKVEENKFNSLKEKEQYKELADAYKAKYEAAENKMQEYSSFYTQDKKMETLKRVAASMGITKEGMEDLERWDFDDVQIETTSTGRVNVLGAQEAIESLKMRRPSWFNDSRPPVVNNGQPQNTGNKKLSPSEILNLERKDPAAYQAYMKKMLAERSF